MDFHKKSFLMWKPGRMIPGWVTSWEVLVFHFLFLFTLLNSTFDEGAWYKWLPHPRFFFIPPAMKSSHAFPVFSWYIIQNSLKLFEPRPRDVIMIFWRSSSQSSSLITMIRKTPFGNSSKKSAPSNLPLLLQVKGCLLITFIVVLIGAIIQAIMHWIPSEL